MGACPERIISFQDYSVHMVAEMIKSFEVPEDYEEKPRIIALMCENDAVPALDAAAANGATWNPWTRIIPVRCLGSMNIVWLAEALSRGVDGVILIGCKFGDDYQCHYVRGSELANTRLDNVGETLERLALEPERVKLVELSHDEFGRIPTDSRRIRGRARRNGPEPAQGLLGTGTEKEDGYGLDPGHPDVIGVPREVLRSRGRERGPVLSVRHVLERLRTGAGQRTVSTPADPVGPVGPEDRLIADSGRGCATSATTARSAVRARSTRAT